MTDQPSVPEKAEIPAHWPDSTTWVIVTANPASVLLSAQCICHDPNCIFKADVQANHIFDRNGNPLSEVVNRIIAEGNKKYGGA